MWCVLVDLCQCFCKSMKKIYTYQIFLCFLNGERYKALIFNNLTELSLMCIQRKKCKQAFGLKGLTACLHWYRVIKNKAQPYSQTSLMFSLLLNSPPSVSASVLLKSQLPESYWTEPAKIFKSGHTVVDNMAGAIYVFFLFIAIMFVLLNCCNW